MPNLTVLFEDEDLIAIDKPPGWLAHASVDRSRLDAFRTLRDQLGVGGGSLAIAHRIDRDTSGVLLFTKTTRVHGAVAQMFRDRQISKVYWGVTAGRPRRQSWVTENFLAEEKVAASRTPRSLAVRSGGLKAITEFRVLAEAGGLTLVEARPLTGRRHQIRSHLREVRCPLIGDELYGGAPGPRCLLHARRLEFAHPLSGARIVIEAPKPADFPDFPGISGH